MEDKKPKENSARPDEMNRRSFLGAAGLAASAAFLGPISELLGTDSSYYYLNSFGEVVPVSQELIDLGVFPPPLPPGTQGLTSPQEVGRTREIRGGARHHEVPMDDTITTGFTPKNILMIMVDQLRSPRWVPADGHVSDLQNLTPTITNLQTQSFSFTNFFVAATACTPSRSNLLTGLYTQQTCQFETQATEGCQPNLNPDFWNIASVLKQISPTSIPSFWVGKWHLSDPKAGGSTPGAAGPTDYQFYQALDALDLNFPPDSTKPSPHGGNTGAEGYQPPPALHPTNGAVPSNSVRFPDGNPLYNDAAVVDWFLAKTAPYLANNITTPWFAALSLINPHDITQFPYSYDLSGSANFGSVPAHPPGYCFPPPLTTGSSGVGTVDTRNYGDTYLPALNSIYSTAYNATASLNWNYADSPVGYSGGSGKPDLQLGYQQYMNNTYGQCDGSIVSWNTFLNYYFWMQSCVDYQIGRFLRKLPSSLLTNTIILFLSDHGEYGGSHNLHAKGGAIYDEAINVPFFVSYPQMRPANFTTTPGNGPHNIPFVCSMVDVLPFIYASFLGNDFNWRANSNSVIHYLAGRESILDAIYGWNNNLPNWLQQRRLSSIPNLNNAASVYNNQTLQPYILTTTDEFQSLTVNGNAVPTHVVGFRTVDLTVRYPNADSVNVYGGGKLGVYSFWPPVPNPPNSSNVGPSLTQPNPANANQQQYEFYDYTGSYPTVVGNYPEIGNNWLTSPMASNFLAAFNNVAVQNELYPPNAYTLGPYNAAYQAALLAWAKSATNSICTSGPAPLNEGDAV